MLSTECQLIQTDIIHCTDCNLIFIQREFILSRVCCLRLYKINIILLNMYLVSDKLMISTRKTSCNTISISDDVRVA